MERKKELEVMDSFFEAIVLSIDQATRYGWKKFELQQKLAEDLFNAVEVIRDKVEEIFGQAEKILWELNLADKKIVCRIDSGRNKRGCAANE
jgi:hypothetical protein